MYVYTKGQVPSALSPILLTMPCGEGYTQGNLGEFEGHTS